MIPQNYQFISYLSKFSGLQAAWEHLQNDQYVIGVAIGTLAITLNIHTKSHTVRGRPTLKLVERFGNGSVRELYERSIYERSFTSEPSIEKYQAKPAHVNTTVYLDVIENPVEYQKLL